MTMSPIAFPICHPREIEETAVFLVNRIAASRGTISDIITHIHTTAVTQQKYTRSLVLLVKKMVEDLQWRNIDLYITFQEDIIDRAVSTFINYWRNSLYPIPRGNIDSDLDDLNPFAINAYIGDLFSLGMLSITMFQTCAGYLISRISSVFHLQCLFTLFAHAGAYSNTEIGPLFIRDCLNAILYQAGHIGASSRETSTLTELLYHLMSRTPDEIFPQWWDRTMNLEDAMMASVCSPKSLSSQQSSSISISSLDSSPERPYIQSNEFIPSMESVQMKVKPIWECLYNSPPPEDLPDLHLFGIPVA